jgi:hypothetical protein
MLLPQGPIVEAAGTSLLMSSVDHEALYVQSQDGALHQVSTDEATADLPPVTSRVHKFPSSAPEVQVVNVEGQVGLRPFSSTIMKLTVIDNSFWPDQERRTIRQRPYPSPELHVLRHHHCASHIHDDSAPSEICTSC